MQIDSICSKTKTRDRFTKINLNRFIGLEYLIFDKRKKNVLFLYVRPVVGFYRDGLLIIWSQTQRLLTEKHGIASKLVTGNDTQYTSSAFKDFSNSSGFVHTTTSPYYPQANGFIERTVQTVKNVFQKCKESGADPHLAMLCLRTTPLDHSIPSPAELLNSRAYQSNLPIVSKTGLLSNLDDVSRKLYETIMISLQGPYPLSSPETPYGFSIRIITNGNQE